MSTRTTNTCDRCKKEVEEKNDSERFHYVQVCVTDKETLPGGYNPTLVHRLQAHWCRSCCEATGLVWLPPKVGVPEPTPITIETLLAELIDERIAADKDGP